jgi:hypothetical protein
MATLVDKLIALERRIIALENAANITPDKSDLVHPKSITQAEFIKEEEIKRQTEVDLKSVADIIEGTEEKIP